MIEFLRNVTLLVLVLATAPLWIAVIVVQNIVGYWRPSPPPLLYRPVATHPAWWDDLKAQRKAAEDAREAAALARPHRYHPEDDYPF